MINELIPESRPVDIILLPNPLEPSEPDVVLAFLRDNGKTVGFRFSYQSAQNFAHILKVTLAGELLYQNDQEGPREPLTARLRRYLTGRRAR